MFRASCVAAPLVMILSNISDHAVNLCTGRATVSSAGVPSAENFDMDTKLSRGKCSCFDCGLPVACIVRGTACFVRLAFPGAFTVRVAISSMYISQISRRYISGFTKYARDYSSGISFGR